MIDIETLKEYIKVLEDSSLAVIELSDDNDAIRLEKAYATSNVQVVGTSDGVTACAAVPAAEPAPVKAAVGRTIHAPIVGVFYAAPSPDSAPYVSVGQRVKKGDTVCIIEAMKCMNEIQAEEDGVIAEVLAKNGALVEYDQPLFSLE